MSSSSAIVIPLIDSPPFDSIIVRGIAFRQRPSRSQKTSMENSSPGQTSCTNDSAGVRARKKSSSSRFSARKMLRDPKPRRAFTRTGKGKSEGSSSGSQAAGEPIPRSCRKRCVTYLSFVRSATSAPGRSRSAPSSSRCSRQDRHIEVGEGNDQLDAVLGDGRGKGGHIPRVVDAWREEVPVGRVERGRERVQVGRDRLAPGAPEGGDDVDTLARAREEDGGHPCRQPPVSPR